MNRPPSESSVQDLLRRAGLRGTVQAVSPLPSARLQRLCRVQLAEHDPLVLVLAPSPALRLLRSEQGLIESEAGAVRWLRAVVEGDTSGAGSIPSEASRIPGGTRRQTTPGVTAPASGADLAGLLPLLLAHAPSSPELGSAFNLLSQTAGQPICSLPKPLTRTERRNVEFQLGGLVRQMSQITSPSRRFGPLLAVSSQPPELGRPQDSAGFRQPPGQGAANWSAAFQLMLEGVLRDGEDMAVTVAYSAIRRHFRRLGHILDGVTIPRLVVVDAAEDSNTMVVLSRSGDPHLLKDARLDIRELCRDEEDSDQQEPSGEDSANARSEVVVAGLRDWSSCIFADPLLATAFCDEPSTDFRRGFGGLSGRGKEAPVEPGDDLVEDRGNADVRLLLYQCYHATASIVREFYRPQSNSTTKELAARKRLSEVLSKLDKTDDGPKRWRRRPSGELSPAKRPKPEDSQSS